MSSSGQRAGTRRRVVRGASVFLVGLLVLLGAPWLVTSGVAGTATAAAVAVQPSTPAPLAVDVDRDLYDAVLPDERAAIIDATAGALPRYRIDAMLARPSSDDPGSITGTIELDFVNTIGAPLAELYLRLYPNHPMYAEGNIELSSVMVAGVATTPEPVAESEGTAVRLPLPAPLALGESVTLSGDFETTVPVRPRLSYGMFSIEPSTGSWALAHWFPMLAGFTAADGWNIGPLSENGDPIFSNTALFDVTLTAPQDLVLVTTGVATRERATGDLIERRYFTGPVRDFTMVADDDFASVSQMVDGVLVTSYYNPADTDAGQRVLDYGVQSLVMFNDLFGPYPYAEMDLVEVDLRGGVAGIEFPQLMMIGTDYYGNQPESGPLADFLEFTVAHEVAHQWLYGMIGNDPYVDAFIDEGLTNYLTTVYFERQYGADEGEHQRDLNLRLSYLSTLFSSGDEVADQPTDDFQSQQSYGAIIYGKAALGFGAIRQEIGDDAFFAALRDYANQERFGVATPADLQAAFEQAADADIDAIWQFWFDEANGDDLFTFADYEQILAALGLG